VTLIAVLIRHRIVAEMSVRRSTRIAAAASKSYVDVSTLTKCETDALAAPCKAIQKQIDATVGVENRTPLIHSLYRAMMRFPDQIAYHSMLRATSLAALDRLILECNQHLRYLDIQYSPRPPQVDYSLYVRTRRGLRQLRQEYLRFTRTLKDLPTWRPDVPPLVLP
jgi:hypothetical protein